MTVEMETVPRVPVARTGHFDLLSGPVDFSLEDLQAAANAFHNDPAALAPRLRIEGYGQGHLDAEGIAVEAQGGQGGPSIGWCDNLAVEGNSLLADLHMPAVLAANMEWAYPSRSIEGCHNITTATGQHHAFMATGLLLLGTSPPGVSTLPDFSEVQAEFQAEVAAGAIAVGTFAAPQGDFARPLALATVAATMPATARPPAAVVQAGLNVGDLAMRWYNAEREGDLELPESYDYNYWYVTETRVADDGTLFALVIDESSSAFWRFDVASVDGPNVTWAAPVEVMVDIVPVTAGAPATRPALARFASRPASASAPPTIQEDDHPMTDEERRTFAASYGLDPATATDADINAAATARAAELAEASPDEPVTPPEPEPVVEDEPVTARTATVSEDTLAQLQADAAEGVAARTEQVKAERDGIIAAALKVGKITPAESDAWRADLDEAPEVTARAIERLTPGKIPSTSRAVSPQESGGNPDSLKRVLATVPNRTTKDKVA